MKATLFILLSILAGFGAGALFSFMVSFTYVVLRHGGLW
jgi:hypothetical protein